MPITILDYVKSQIGENETYIPENFFGNHADMLGSCERCEATVAAENAYPSKSGYWRCAECIGSDGFVTVEEFTDRATGWLLRLRQLQAEGLDSATDLARATAEADEYDPDEVPVSWCPVCDSAEESRKNSDGTFECPDCGTVYSL